VGYGIWEWKEESERARAGGDSQKGSGERPKPENGGCEETLQTGFRVENQFRET